MRVVLSAISLSLLLVGIAPAVDSLNVRLVGHCQTPPSYVTSVTLSGEYAYIADGALRVISVADPAHPVEVAHLDTFDYTWAVAVAGDYAYVAGDDGLDVISVSDPAHPVVVGRCGALQGGAGVAVGGGYAYLADASAGLRVISVADPAHPVEVGHYDTPGLASDVATAGTCAYIADHASGLRVISVADPAHPVEVGSTDSTIGADKVALNGENAYVTYEHNLLVISVADSAHPVKIGQCHLTSAGGALDVAVSGTYAYVTADDGGLRVVSVADPANPREVGYYAQPFARGIDVLGDYAYVGMDVYGGLWVFQSYGQGVAEAPNVDVQEARSQPSVVRGVLFLLPSSGLKRSASNVLLDVSGRKVMDLRPGANDVRALVPSVYFVRRAPGVERDASSVIKLVIAK
jgi:hypothetical protein